MKNEESINYLCEQIPNLISIGMVKEAQVFAEKLAELIEGYEPFEPLWYNNQDVTDFTKDKTVENISDCNRANMNKITAIKEFRILTGASLKDSKEFVEGHLLDYLRKNGRYK